VTTGLGFHAADLDLVWVLAADPDAEREPARLELSQGGQLAGDGNGVAQREQVEPDVHRQHPLASEQRGRGDQPIRARAREEADVIADAEVVDFRLDGASEHGIQVSTVAELSGWREKPDARPRRRWAASLLPRDVGVQACSRLSHGCLPFGLDQR
jgi:hypothetical protein